MRRHKALWFVALLSIMIAVGFSLLHPQEQVKAQDLQTTYTAITNVVNNHVHSLSISRQHVTDLIADLENPDDEIKLQSSQEYNNDVADNQIHSHTVSLDKLQLQVLQATGTLDVESDEVMDHKHIFRFIIPKDCPDFSQTIIINYPPGSCPYRGSCAYPLPYPTTCKNPGSCQAPCTTCSAPYPLPTPCPTCPPYPFPVPTTCATCPPYPTPTGTVTPAPTGTVTPTPTVTGSPTATPSPTATASPSPTASPTATASPSPTESPTASPSPSPTPTESPSPSPTPSPSPSPSPTPTESPDGENGEEGISLPF